MRVLHVSYCFYPDPVGGTEVYVEALAQEMQKLGLEVAVAAPAQRETHYSHKGLPVWRYAVSPTPQDLRELYGAGDVRAAQSFLRVLEESKPGIVHLHALTRGVSLAMVRQVKRLAIPVVFTYHTPTVSCQRGTLMRWGTEVCEGLLELTSCTCCTLQGLGLPRAMALLIGRTPVALGTLLGSLHCSGGAWTALRMRALVRLRHATFRDFMAEADHIVALCKWAQALLVRNGIPRDKITLSPHGLPHQPPRIQEAEADQLQASQVHTASEAIRVVYLGRLSPEKGLDILVQALRALPGAPVELHVYGIDQGGAYAEQVRKLAAEDPRITYHSPVPRERVIPLLSRYDLLAVPSRCVETGPQVVLEAFAAGIPVMGSNLGGIAELVENGVNGLLIGPDDIPAWIRQLRSLLEEPGLLKRLREGVRPPRKMREVAQEMIELYRNLLRRAA